MTLPFAEARALADDARARGLDLAKALSVAVVAILAESTPASWYPW